MRKDAFHRSFFPKIRLLLILNWQVFWLASLFAAFPSPKGTVAEVAKSLQRHTAAGTAPVLHRIPFSDKFSIKKTHQPICSKSKKLSFYHVEDDRF
jgi:hypothetical protein